MGLSTTPLCSFCNSDNETISHLFYHCNVAKSLWLDLQQFFSNKITIPDLDLQSAVVGFLDKGTKDNIFVNNVLLMFKITLYRNRDKGSVILNNVINNLKTRETIEKNIAGNNASKLGYHVDKWRIFYDIFYS